MHLIVAHLTGQDVFIIFAALGGAVAILLLILWLGWTEVIRPLVRRVDQHRRELDHQGEVLEREGEYMDKIRDDVRENRDEIDDIKGRLNRK